LQNEFTKSKFRAEARDNFVIGNSDFAFPVGKHRHFQPLGRVSAKVGNHSAAIVFQVAFQQRVIDTVAGFFRNLPCKG
jgi:hypothetical protein